MSIVEYNGSAVVAILGKLLRYRQRPAPQRAAAYCRHRIPEAVSRYTECCALASTPRHCTSGWCLSAILPGAGGEGNEARYLHQPCLCPLREKIGCRVDAACKHLQESLSSALRASQQPGGDRRPLLFLHCCTADKERQGFPDGEPRTSYELEAWVIWCWRYLSITETKLIQDFLRIMRLTQGLIHTSTSKLLLG